MYATRSLSFEDTPVAGQQQGKDEYMKQARLLDRQPLPDRGKARTNTWNKLDSLTGCALAPDEFPLHPSNCNFIW